MFTLEKPVKYLSQVTEMLQKMHRGKQLLDSDSITALLTHKYKSNTSRKHMQTVMNARTCHLMLKGQNWSPPRPALAEKFNCLIRVVVSPNRSRKLANWAEAKQHKSVNANFIRGQGGCTFHFKPRVCFPSPAYVRASLCHVF